MEKWIDVKWTCGHVGKVESKERAEFEKHNRACPACRLINKWNNEGDPRRTRLDRYILAARVAKIMGIEIEGLPHKTQKLFMYIKHNRGYEIIAEAEGDEHQSPYQVLGELPSKTIIGEYPIKPGLSREITRGRCFLSAFFEKEIQVQSTWAEEDYGISESSFEGEDSYRCNKHSIFTPHKKGEIYYIKAGKTPVYLGGWPEAVLHPQDHSVYTILSGEERWVQMYQFRNPPIFHILWLTPAQIEIIEKGGMVIR